MLIAWFLRRVFRLRRDLRQLASYRRIPAARSAVGTTRVTRRPLARRCGPASLESERFVAGRRNVIVNSIELPFQNSIRICIYHEMSYRGLVENKANVALSLAIMTILSVSIWTLIGKSSRLYLSLYPILKIKYFKSLFKPFYFFLPLGTYRDKLQNCILYLDQTLPGKLQTYSCVPCLVLIPFELVLCRNWESEYCYLVLNGSLH
jgi:hypothetical protein